MLRVPVARSAGGEKSVLHENLHRVALGATPGLRATMKDMKPIPNRGLPSPRPACSFLSGRAAKRSLRHRATRQARRAAAQIYCGALAGLGSAGVIAFAHLFLHW